RDHVQVVPVVVFQALDRMPRVDNAAFNVVRALGRNYVLPCALLSGRRSAPRHSSPCSAIPASRESSSLFYRALSLGISRISLLGTGKRLSPPHSGQPPEPGRANRAHGDASPRRSGIL